ncbi:hypothetical protein [Legionella waltersii]|uniref:Dot/Icm T4SS effector n=1 Tax=Legionella waltersii TaxID=66969 RepID=A0A0W1A053_9GAMM|nr:hypothetical protein [Legionella waltersii]KTD74678.1 Dot/Icm T4SS effector [Legionella waltersii]SNV09182.1 Dot/Icm T4SS effector [Legionella waltersii]
MTTVIKADGDGPSLFNALAIGLGVEILSGRLDAFQETPAYQALLDEFAKLHPQFKPKAWKTLKEWLIYYNNARDIELILAPVLLKLNQHYQLSAESEALEELTDLVLKFKANIASGNQWFQLELVGNFCPRLDNLLLDVRNKLLLDLSRLLQGIELGSNREAIKEFLAKNATVILGDLKDKFESDKNAFQRSYSVKDVKALSDALSLDVSEGSIDAPSKKQARVVVENKQQYWVVKFNDRDASIYLDRTPQRLKLTPLEAYQGEKSVKSPSIEESQEVAKESVVHLKRIIDNPGLGNCAFYAFATAVLSIIVQEKNQGKREMFDRWVKLDPSVSDLYDRLPALYDSILRNNMGGRDKELLDQLQSSLRIITYQYQVSELRNSCAKFHIKPKDLEENSNFVQFAYLYYGNPIDTDPRFNPFANSPDILRELQKIDRRTVIKNHENDVLMPIFLKLVYGDKVEPKDITYRTEPQKNSPILVAMNGITQDFFWGSHIDLDYLSIAFNLNLHVLRNQNAVQEYPNDLPNQHTITLQNLNNAHWTTEVIEARKIPAIDALSVQNPTRKSEQPTLSTQSISLFGVGSPLGLNSTLLQSRTSAGSEASGEQEVEELTADQRKLEYLKRIVAKATLAYTDYNKSIWFCFFHYHGRAGRDRAEQFNQDFSKIRDFETAKTSLLKYLGDNSNGNTHAHSYRTMLLHELQGAREDKKSLQFLSENYSKSLKRLREDLKPQVPEYSMSLI